MSCNAHHRSIIFSSDRQKVIDKLSQISMMSNMPIIRISKDSIESTFDDEQWVWVDPSRDIRGYRAHKALVDMDCTIRQLEYVIKPMCEGHCENLEYFNT